MLPTYCSVPTPLLIHHFHRLPPLSPRDRVHNKHGPNGFSLNPRYKRTPDAHLFFSLSNPSPSKLTPHTAKPSQPNPNPLPSTYPQHLPYSLTITMKFSTTIIALAAVASSAMAVVPIPVKGEFPFFFSFSTPRFLTSVYLTHQN